MQMRIHPAGQQAPYDARPLCQLHAIMELSVRTVCLYSDDNILHGRKWHNGTFGMGGNGTRPARTKTVQGNVKHGTKLQHGSKLQKDTFGYRKLHKRCVRHDRKCYNVIMGGKNQHI